MNSRNTFFFIVAFACFLSSACSNIQQEKQLEIRWEYTNNNIQFSDVKSLAAVGDLIVAHRPASGTLLAISQKTGELQWEYDSKSAHISKVIGSSDKLYFSSWLESGEQGLINCLDTKTGELIWSFSLPTGKDYQSLSEYAYLDVFDNKLIYSDDDRNDSVYVLDRIEGKSLFTFAQSDITSIKITHKGFKGWQSDIITKGGYFMDFSKEKIFRMTAGAKALFNTYFQNRSLVSNGMSLEAIDLGSGISLWNMLPKQDHIILDMQSYRQYVLLQMEHRDESIKEDNYLVCVELKNGTIVWEKLIPDTDCHSFDLIDNVLVFDHHEEGDDGTDYLHLVAYNLSNGEFIGQAPLSDKALWIESITGNQVGDMIYCSTSDGIIYSLAVPKAQ